MKYTVHGTRTEVISITVDAEDADEAMGLAEDEQFSGRDVDVWDSNYRWDVAVLDE